VCVCVDSFRGLEACNLVTWSRAARGLKSFCCLEVTSDIGSTVLRSEIFLTFLNFFFAYSALSWFSTEVLVAFNGVS
jgi:hypothetical protein